MAETTSSTPPYYGEEKIVIAFDIGTTHSTVSFVHLRRGLVPVVRVVTRWPGQEEAASISKTPSCVCYDGIQPFAYGAEALDSAAKEPRLAKWFKLHLNRKAEAGSDFEIPPLPQGITLRQVYIHYMTYLYDHARTFFISTSVDGQWIWTKLASSAVIVLAMSNGWDIVEQGFLKEAAIAAGLFPGKFDPGRLHFVTEGKASIHHVLQHSPGPNRLKPNDIVAVLNVGCATVVTTLYRCRTTTPLALEVCTSGCIQAGSAFVDMAALEMFKKKLAQSKFGASEYIEDIMDEFERKTRRKFDGSEAHSFIKFGRDSDNDHRVGIVRGRLKLTSDDIKSTFNGCIQRILVSFRNLISHGNGEATYLLVGGTFGESVYLRKRLQEALGPQGLTVVAVDCTTTCEMCLQTFVCTGRNCQSIGRQYEPFPQMIPTNARVDGPTATGCYLMESTPSHAGITDTTNLIATLQNQNDSAEITLTDIILSGPIKTGRYLISNARSGGLAALLNSHDQSDVVAVIPGLENDVGDQWDVVLLPTRAGPLRYKIQNHKYALHGSSNGQAEEGGYLCGKSKPRAWVIKETKTTGQYTISPTLDQDLCWGLVDGEHRTPLRLNHSAVDMYNQWIFLRVDGAE